MLASFLKLPTEMWGRPLTDPGFWTICVFETICRFRLSCANNPFFGRKNRNGTKPTRIGARWVNRVNPSK